jgi:NADPH2:quinone reductase
LKAYMIGADGPVLSDAPEPVPGDGQVVLRVRAAALNRADLGMAKGKAYGARGGIGTVLGTECAGQVVAIGPGVSGVAVGDRLMSVAPGAFADYVAVDHRRAYAMPEGFSFDQATTLPVSLSTMHNAVITAGAVQPGQAVLVQGASSGVGLMALQIARLKGARVVIGTSTEDVRRARLMEFGADMAIDPRDPSWIEQILDATDGEGVDLVVDQVSGPLINDTMRATRIGGRIVNVGRLGGMRADIDLDLHALRRIHFIGVTFRTRTREEIHAISAGVRADLLDAVADRRLSPI